jgi:hypothetical protein
MQRAAPDSEPGYVDAAKLLARCVAVAGEDKALDPPRLQEIRRKCAGRIVIFFREAVDSNPKLGDRLRSDPELSPFLTQPEFQSLLGSLVTQHPSTVR